MKRTIIFYRFKSGHSPVSEFIDSLDSTASQKVAWVLKLIEELDIVPKKFFKKLPGTDDIWECKARIGNIHHRIFAFFVENNNLILTHGYCKKSRKADPDEIHKAENYKTEYLKRKGGLQ